MVWTNDTLLMEADYKQLNKLKVPLTDWHLRLN